MHVSLNSTLIGLAVICLVPGYFAYDYYQRQQRIERDAEVQRLADERAKKDEQEKAQAELAERAHAQALTASQTTPAQPQTAAQKAADDFELKKKRREEATRAEQEWAAKKQKELDDKRAAEIAERQRRLEEFQALAGGQAAPPDTRSPAMKAADDNKPSAVPIVTVNNPPAVPAEPPASLPVFHLADGRVLTAYESEYVGDSVRIKDARGVWTVVKMDKVLNITQQ